MDCAQIVGGFSRQDIEDIICVVGESYPEKVHCKHINLWIKVVQSIVKK
jgi:hypothetical protein